MVSKSIVGMEVPYIGSDSIKWVEASVPDLPDFGSGSAPVASGTQDYASSSVIGSPPTYLIWRIRKKLPNAIEILELGADKEIPAVGLRVILPEALSPYAYICRNERNSAHGNVYFLYTISVSGVAFVIQLKSLSAYATSFVFSSNEFLHLDTKISADCPVITAVTATAGCLVIGRDDGSVTCFKLGLDRDTSGFLYELKDDATFSRLWGLMSRSKFAGSVKDLMISEIHGTKVTFVLHSDGIVRIWDLHSCSKLLSQSISDPGTISRLWVGSLDADASLIYLAILHEQDMEISIYNLNVRPGERYSMLLDSSMPYITLSQGKLVDVKFSSNKIWVLMEDDLSEWDLGEHVNV